MHAEGGAAGRLSPLPTPNFFTPNNNKNNNNDYDNNIDKKA